MNYRHGHAGIGAKSRTYAAWEQLRYRAKHHPEYAGRGISCDPRWADFSVFLADMGECPDGLTIDRIDNDGGYYKDNCRWTTHSVQNANQRKRRPRTTRHGNARLADDQVLAIVNDHRTRAQISSEYGISSSYVSKLKRGEAYKYLTARRD